MSEIPLSLDQLPPIQLNNLVGVTASGRDAFLAAQSSGGASGSNRLATINDVVALSGGSIYSTIGLFSNNGFACGLDCWENEAPYPIAAYPLTEVDKVRIEHAFAGPTGTDLSCGCPGLGITVTEGYEGCSFEAIAQKRDYKCCDLLICDPEMTIELKGYVWGSDETRGVKPYARLQFYNEGVYLGERKYQLSPDFINPGEGGVVSPISILYNIEVSCCADEVRAVLGFETPDGTPFEEDLYIFIQSFQIIGRMAAVFGPLCRQVYDNPVINLVAKDGNLKYSLAACQETTLLERSEEAPGFLWDAGAKKSGNWRVEEVISNYDLKKKLENVGCGIEVQRTTQYDPGWDDAGYGWVKIDTPLHNDVLSADTFDLDFRYVANPKAAAVYTQARLLYRRNSTHNGAYTNGPTLAIPGTPTFSVDLNTLTGGPNGMWEFVVELISSNPAFMNIYSQVVRVYRNTATQPDYDERPIRFVNTADPICNHFVGLRISRDLNYLSNTAFRPSAGYFDLSKGQKASHLIFEIECAISDSHLGSMDNLQFNPLSQDAVNFPIRLPLMMLTDVNNISVVIGQIRLLNGNNLVPQPGGNLQTCRAWFGDTAGSPNTVIPLTWITGQPNATSNSNSLVPFDYSKVKSIEIIAPSSQMLIRSLIIRRGEGDNAANDFVTPLDTIEVDLTDEYTENDIHVRWTQVGPAVKTVHYDDTRHYWWIPYNGDLNYGDEFELSPTMTLFSRRAFNNMSTSFKGCPTDEQEFDVNYIALHRSTNFFFPINDSDRDIFYSVIRRTFDDQGYLDISDTCKINDSIKTRFLFPDIQFTAACPENHYYQFQATLVDDRGNKLVGSWTPVISPRNEEVTCRTERWADADNFQYNNGTFTADRDTLYAAQLEDFNFKRVSEVIIRVMGVRPQSPNLTSLWDEYTDNLPTPPSQTLSWAGGLFQMQLVPVGWHEGQLIVNVHMYPYNELTVGLDTLDQLNFTVQTDNGFVTDLLTYGTAVIASQTGLETNNYTLSLNSINSAVASNAVCSLLIGGLPASVRNGTQKLNIVLTINNALNLGATGFFAPTPRQLVMELDTEELPETIDIIETNRPCIALTNFVVQGPAGSQVLDNLCDYDLDSDPAGAIECFRRRWSELYESNTVSYIDNYSTYNPDSPLSRRARIINYDGGLMVLFDNDGDDAEIELSEFEAIEVRTDIHAQRMHISANRNNTHLAGTNKFGWNTAYKFAPVVNFTWTNTDPYTSEATEHDALVVIDLDWNTLAGRSTKWATGVNNVVWISKRELRELGVFLIDPNFSKLPDDTIITLRRAGFFYEAYTNQITALDANQFDVTLFGNSPPSDPNLGEALFDEIGLDGGDAAPPFTIANTTNFLNAASLLSQSDLEDICVPIFNRALTSPLASAYAGTRLQKAQTTSYNLGVGIEATGRDKIAGLGFLLPQGVVLSTLTTITVDVEVLAGAASRVGFAVARTNYGRQFTTEQLTIGAGVVTLNFSSLTTALAATKAYEPSNWDYGRIYIDEGTEGFFSTPFAGNYSQLGAERVTAIEFYVISLQHAGTDLSIRVSRVTTNNAPSVNGFFNAALSDATFNGYDCETMGRMVNIDLSSDINFCKIHSAAANARSNRSTVFLHLRNPSRYGTPSNDRLSTIPTIDLATLNKLLADIRTFTPCYAMIVAQEDDGTDWQIIDSDNLASRLLIQESPELRSYARTQIVNRWSDNDNKNISFYPYQAVLEATSFDDPIDDIIIALIPTNAIHAPSVDIDDLALRASGSPGSLLFGDTFDYRNQMDLLRNWDVLLTPGRTKLGASSVPHPHVYFDAFNQNNDGSRRHYFYDRCGEFWSNNQCNIGDSLNKCKLPLIFSAEPDHTKYYDDDHYDDGGRGMILVPSKAGNEAVAESKARTGEVYFHNPRTRGVNNQIAAYIYQKHTGCCLGVPIESREVEFSAPECNCGGGPAGIVGITNFITHPKLPQIITDDNFTMSGFPSGVERNLYGPSLCFSYKRDAVGGGTEWVDFDSSEISPKRVFYGGGGRPDPTGPYPSDNLYVTVWLGPNSAPVSDRQAYLSVDANLDRVTEHEFSCGVHDVSGFAVGYPVWIRNGCSPTGCKYDLCAVQSSDDPNIRGIYGEVTSVDIPGSKITVKFNEPVSGNFIVTQYAEILVSPEGAMGFYWEATPDFLNEVTNPDPNMTIIRWGFRYWEHTEPLGECGCGDGGGMICDSDGNAVFYNLLGEDTSLPLHPRDFFGSFNTPVQHELLLANATPGQDYVEICNPEKFEDNAPIAIVDNSWTNGFVARVVGRDILRKRLYLDRRLPLATESLCGWEPTLFNGFATARQAIIYRLSDFTPVDTLSITDYKNSRGLPDYNKVHVDMNLGIFTFHPNQANKFWMRYVGNRTNIKLPAKAGLYRLVGVDACGIKTQPSEYVTILANNRLNKFFEDRGYMVIDGDIMPLDAPYPDPSVPPPFAGGETFYGGYTPPGGVTSVNYQLLIYDAPPPGPMPLDPSGVNTDNIVTSKMGSNDIGTPLTYDVRVYLTQITREAITGKIRRQFVGEVGDRWAITNVSPNVVTLIGNANAGAEIELQDGGAGAPYADCTLETRLLGPAVIELTRLSGTSPAPATERITIVVDPPSYSYAFRAYDESDVTLGNELTTIPSDGTTQFRIALVRRFGTDNPGAGYNGPTPPVPDDFVVPASNIDYGITLPQGLIDANNSIVEVDGALSSQFQSGHPQGATGRLALDGATLDATGALQLSVTTPPAASPFPNSGSTQNMEVTAASAQTSQVEFNSSGSFIDTQFGPGTATLNAIVVTTSNGLVTENDITVTLTRTGGTATDPEHFTDDFPKNVTIPAGSAHNSVHSFQVTHAGGVTNKTVILLMTSDADVTGPQTTHTVTIDQAGT